MEEVVAKRHNAAGAGYIVVIVIGLFILVLGCILGLQTEEGAGALLIGIVIGGIILAMGIYYTVRFFMIPSKAVVFKDGVLYFPRKLVCRPEELQGVFIKVFRNARYGNVSKYGKLEVTVGGKVYKYNDIANVKVVQERLLELNKQAIDMLNNPEPSAEQTEAPAEDPFADIGN